MQIPSHDLPQDHEQVAHEEGNPPVKDFLRVVALMNRLGLTPADCLSILADTLGDLHGQIREHEQAEQEGQHLGYPRWCYGH